MELRAAFATDIGRKRTQNQDSFMANPELGLFVVADGMGGHRGGEIASAMAVEKIPELFKKLGKVKDWNPKSVLIEAIQLANQAIHERGEKQPELAGMGTTVTSLVFKNDIMTVGQVGDSRCYFFRPGAVWQVTRDHSLVQEKLRAGLINREEAKVDRMKNVITRSVGFESNLNVEVYEMSIKPGDVFLICSDGLSGLISDLEMLKVVEERVFAGKDLESAVKLLIDGANMHGGDDNITVIMVEILKT